MGTSLLSRHSWRVHCHNSAEGSFDVTIAMHCCHGNAQILYFCDVMIRDIGSCIRNGRNFTEFLFITTASRRCFI